MGAFDSAKKITVTITGDTSGLNKSFGTAIREADTFGKKMGVVGGTLKGMMGPALIGAAAAAGAFAIKLGVDAVQAAAAEQKELAVLKQTLDNVGQGFAMDTVNQFVDDLRFATGVSDSELRPALSKIIGVTKDAASAQQLLAAAVDASVGSGKDLSTVSQAIAKAAAGSTTSLKKLIPELDATKLKTGGLEAVLAAVEDRFGGSAAAAAQTFQGQMQRLQDGASELQESFGTGLLNALDDTNQAAGDLAQTLRDLQPAAQSAGGAVGNALSGVVPILQGLGGAVQWVTDNYNDFNVVNRELLATIGSNVVAGPFGFLVKAVWDYNAAMGAASESTTTFGDTVTTDLIDAGKRAVQSANATSDAFGRQYFTLTEVTSGAGVYTDQLSLLRSEMNKTTVGLGFLSAAFDEANAAMARRQAMQDYRDALKTFIDDPSASTRDAAVQAMEDVAASMKDPAQQGRFVSKAFEDITGAAKDAGVGIPPDLAKIGSAASAQLDPVASLKQAMEEIPTNIQSQIAMHVTVNGKYYDPYGGYNKATGGPVYATGGMVRAAMGTHASDNVPAMLSRGEYVLNADTVRRLGVGTLNAMNNGGSMGGGGVTIQTLNVNSVAGERAEESVPRALRRLAFVAGLNG